MTLLVPTGTIVDRRGDEPGAQGSRGGAGDWIVAAKGAPGGWGNLHFKIVDQPRPRQTTPGEKGEVRRLLLELKVIADVGLVGKPNAGKSTLLSRLSRARPEIADYAFTTKTPILGIVAVSRDRSFVLADLPGLIEGAHAGIGLGHEFLRHVERAGILVHVVEPSPVDGSDPLANYRSIRAELVRYDATLGDRPEIVVMSKSELPGADEVRSAGWQARSAVGDRPERRHGPGPRRPRAGGGGGTRQAEVARMTSRRPNRSATRSWSPTWATRGSNSPWWPIAWRPARRDCPR